MLDYMKEHFLYEYRRKKENRLRENNRFYRNKFTTV